MKTPLQTYLTLATESAKRSLRESGNANPSDLQAAVIVINELNSRFPPDALRNAVYGQKGVVN